MKLVTWNVNGIRAAAKKGLLEFIAKEKPDLLCLQETKAHPDQVEPEIVKQPGYISYWSAARRKGYSGVATFVKESVQVKQIEYGIGVRKFDDEGRFVITHHPDFVLYNVYFPNGSASEERHHFKQEFLARFHRHLAKEMGQGHEIVLVGDYNVAYLDHDVFDPKRLSKISGFLPEEREWFKQFIDAGFVDVFRHFFPDDRDQYTWWSYQENSRLGNRGWRIDHICVTPGLVKKLKSVQIQMEQLGSDHCPVVVEFK